MCNNRFLYKFDGFCPAPMAMHNKFIVLNPVNFIDPTGFESIHNHLVYDVNIRTYITVLVTNN